jgi:hypothetical protein
MIPYRMIDVNGYISETTDEEMMEMEAIYEALNHDEANIYDPDDDNAEGDIHADDEEDSVCLIEKNVVVVVMEDLQVDL